MDAYEQVEASLFTYILISPPIFNLGIDIRFMLIVSRMIEGRTGHFIRHEFLLCEIAFVGMAVLLAGAITQIFHELCWCVAQCKWYRKRS